MFLPSRAETKLFDRKYELARRAGAELVTGAISKTTMAGISTEVMAAEDYRRMATLSFERGILAKAKMAALAMKVARGAQKHAAREEPFEPAGRIPPVDGRVQGKSGRGEGRREPPARRGDIP